MASPLEPAPMAAPLLPAEVQGEFKLRRRIGSAGIVVMTIFFLGFVPSWVQYFTTADWQLHLDPWFGADSAIAYPYWFLLSHAGLATGWSVLAVFQVCLGIGMFPGVPKTVHRVLGYFLVCLGMYAFGSGAWLEILAYGGCTTWLHLLLAAEAFLHLGLVIQTARQKRRVLHVCAVFSLFVWTLYAGFSRAIGFLLKLALSIPCGIDVWGGYESISAAVCALLLGSVARFVQGSNSMDEEEKASGCRLLTANCLVWMLYSVVDAVHTGFVAHSFLSCPR